MVISRMEISINFIKYYNEFVSYYTVLTRNCREFNQFVFLILEKLISLTKINN